MLTRKWFGQNLGKASRFPNLNQIIENNSPILVTDQGASFAVAPSLAISYNISMSSLITKAPEAFILEAHNQEVGNVTLSRNAALGD